MASMDELLLLFMHTVKGLKISGAEAVALLGGADPYRCLSSNYLIDNPRWREDSLSELERSQSSGIVWSRLGAPDYPRGWLWLSERPLVFHYIGEPVWLSTPMLSVVGSRTPMSETLMWMQRELGLFLRESDVGIVSGGARGVDQWAHRICMDEGRPTICILPSGCLSPYPFGQQEFWDRILESGGCLLSTFGPSDGMRKFNFERRNRWIVGLSPAVLVAEANRRSGSSMTAKLAKEEGREICSVPLHPHSAQGLGNLDLISDGAAMIRGHADLSVFWERSRLSPALFQRLESEREEYEVYEPQPEAGGEPTVTRKALGGDVTDPIGNQQSETNHEATAFSGPLIGDCTEAHAKECKNQAGRG